MEYAKFVKSHSLPEITSLMIERAGKARDLYNWEADNLYTAEIVDGILVVNTFRKSGKGLKHSYRHLYDGEAFATQRIADDKKLDGEIGAYLSVYGAVALDNKSGAVLKECFPDYQLPDVRALEKAEKNINEKKKLKRWQKVKDRIDDRMSCFRKPPQEFFDWIREKLIDKYFFYSYKRGKTQKGFCSHCRKEFSAENVRHKGEIVCPSCGARLLCLSLGKSKAHNFGLHIYATYVEEVDDGGTPAIAERTFSVWANYHKFRDGAAYYDERVYINEWKRAFYSADKSGLTPKKDSNNVFYYNYDNFHSTSEVRWCRPSDRYGYLPDPDAYIYPANLNLVCRNIKGVENMDLAAVVVRAKTTLYNLICAAVQVPALENLAKQGKYKLLPPVISAGLYDFRHSELARYVSYTESSPARFLKLDKLTFKEMGDVSEGEYFLYMEMKKAGYSIDVETLKRYSKHGLDRERGTVIYVLNKNKVTPYRLINYIEKQAKLLRLKGKATFELYRDYSDMVSDVKMQRTESVIFPKDLQKEHDRLIKIKTDLKYSKQNINLKKRGKILHALDYNDGEFLIVAFDKADDFLNESAKLGHCVKTYIDRCAKGETNIYGIRKAESPNEPYFTLTLDNNAKVTQNLGAHNCRPPEDVKKFVRRWEKNIVARHKEEFTSKAKKTA